MPTKSRITSTLILLAMALLSHPVWAGLEDGGPTKGVAQAKKMPGPIISTEPQVRKLFEAMKQLGRFVAKPGEFETEDAAAQRVAKLFHANAISFQFKAYFPESVRQTSDHGYYNYDFVSYDKAEQLLVINPYRWFLPVGGERLDLWPPKSKGS